MSEGPPDRLLTVKELAAYLRLNERTVLKLAAEGPLPAVKVGNQWRFRKAMIDTWLDDQMLGISRPYVEPVVNAGSSGMLLLDLASCFAPTHVLPALAAGTKTTVVDELATHCYRLGLIRDKTWFVGALIERENVMPSATGNGVAFLHTLRRNPEQVVRPFMVLGRSAEGVDFDALDGEPTHLFFVLGLKYNELHLPWLTKLAQMLVRPGALDALLEAPDAEAIYETLIAAERVVAQGTSMR